MDVLARSLTDGNVIMKILVLQVVVAVLVVFLLKKFLEHELFMCALEKIANAPLEQGAEVDEVVVVSAGKLTGDEEFRLRTIIKGRFPGAEITVGKDRSLGGGLVVRAGGHVYDFSLWTRMRRLFKSTDA